MGTDVFKDTKKAIPSPIDFDIPCKGNRAESKKTRYSIESYKHLSSFLVNKLDIFISLPKFKTSENF